MRRHGTRQSGQSAFNFKRIKSKTRVVMRADADADAKAARKCEYWERERKREKKDGGEYLARKEWR